MASVGSKVLLLAPGSYLGDDVVIRWNANFLFSVMSNETRPRGNGRSWFGCVPVHSACVRACVRAYVRMCARMQSDRLFGHVSLVVGDVD